MSPPRVWPEVEAEFLEDYRVFRVTRSVARSPKDEALHSFFRIDTNDWVNIVPVTDEGDIVMVRQYRHGSKRVTLEIPGGLVDPGESPAEAALREMREETGYAADRCHAIGSVNPNPALFSNQLHLFSAEGVRPVGAIANEGSEETAVELVALDDVPELVRSGKIEHALVVAALYQWRLVREE